MNTKDKLDSMVLAAALIVHHVSQGTCSMCHMVREIAKVAVIPLVLWFFDMVQAGHLTE